MSGVKGGLSDEVNPSFPIGGSRRIAGVLFDKDGTLVDFQATWGPAIHAVIHALAAGDSEKVRRQAECLHFELQSRRFRPTSPIIAGATAQYGAMWAQALGRDDLAALRDEIDALSALACLDSLTAIGAPAEILATLRDMGFRTGLATNDAEANAHRHLDQLGLAGLMDFVAGYDSGHGAKPEPGMVEAFALAIGAAPEEIALVGDSRHDLDCARAAGAVAIAALSGLASREELAAHADYVIADISELPALAAQWAAAGLKSISR